MLSINFNHKKQTFWDFASYLQKQNRCSWLDYSLSVTYLERNLDTTVYFHAWLYSVRLIDESRRQSEKRMREIADEVFKQSKRPLLSAKQVNTPMYGV
ncbi:hypothetical protein H2248_009135 [Termitomyces sp. 'cryptogamus']|nr:hypothetical protein H2248_009135 [Termitomyces sp. 'cryptogamus']